MMSEKADLYAPVIALANNPGFQNESAQIQAKALLSEVTGGQIPAFRWTYIARRVVRNMAMATFGLETIAKSHPEEIEALSTAARRFALLWEALAKLRESTSRESALLNAAVNYELAGYQANSACLARSLQWDQPLSQTPSIFEMSALFLQRRFLQLIEVSKRARVEPSLNEGLTSQLFEIMATALAGTGFSQAADFFLRGNESALEIAATSFDNATKLFASLDLVDEYNLTEGIRSLLPVIRKRAIWTLLPPYAPTQPIWQRYLKLLARGTGTSLSRSRSVSELWPSQMQALKSGLLSSTASKIIKMPTSAGKTRIAELAIVHTLAHYPQARCIYVAPYRALVSELEQSFFHTLNDLGYQVSSIVGTYESSDFEDLLFQEASVIVTTPEKLDLLLRTRPELLANTQLFVLDEIQILDDPQRGAKYELLLTRLKRRIPEARFLVLSAVLPQQTLEDFATWFNASPREDIAVSPWRPSVQRYALFEWTGKRGVIRYATDDEIPGLAEFVPGVVEQQQFTYLNPATRRINRKEFPDPANKAQTAAELAFKFAELGPVLVFCSQRNFVNSVAKALQEKLNLLALTGQAIPSYFRTLQSDLFSSYAESTENRSALLAQEWFGGREITSWLQSGIGVHHGDLPDVIRKAIETDFRQRRLRVLIATNTLAQGVNLPVKTIIIHSCSRYDSNTEAQQPISARDYWNIAGRAGRAGEETAGLIIHLKTSASDQRDFEHYLRRREDVEPVQGALYGKLIALTQNRLSEEALKTALDPEILALLAEEGLQAVSEDAMQLFLQESLVQTQVTRNQTSIVRLRTVFTTVARDLAQQIPDLNLLAAYSATGLCSTSCQVIANHIREHEALLRPLLLAGTPDQLGELRDLLLPICLELIEMQPSREFGGSTSQLLARWLEGIGISTLFAEFGDQPGSYENLGRFIDDLFAYRLPWGIAGYIRIAKKMFGIEDDALSDLAKFLPSMVKYGLPDPIACWAMSAGIPIRRTAIEMASVFRQETNNRQYRGFLTWLSTLNTERLHQEFRLQGPLLDDVSRVINTYSINPLLRTLADFNAFLPQEVEVRGIAYEGRDIVALRAELGQRVEVVRDYENSIDRNAILVLLGKQELGYVPREIAQVLAPEIDTGAILDGTIIQIEKGRLPKIVIRIFQR